jgi:hypothetical protein
LAVSVATLIRSGGALDGWPFIAGPGMSGEASGPVVPDAVEAYLKVFDKLVGEGYTRASKIAEGGAAHALLATRMGTLFATVAQKIFGIFTISILA